jgi:hypothetical protein
MPQMFIANISNQIQMFNYRPLELNKVVTLRLSEGEQVRVAPNNSPGLTAPEIDAIIAQHAPYGLININDARSVVGAYTPIIYALGKPITYEQLRRAMDQRIAAMTALGKKMREDDAIRIDHQIQRVNDPPLPLKKLEMSFIEETLCRGLQTAGRGRKGRSRSRAAPVNEQAIASRLLDAWEQVHATGEDLTSVIRPLVEADRIDPVAMRVTLFNERKARGWPDANTVELPALEPEEVIVRALEFIKRLRPEYRSMN